MPGGGALGVECFDEPVEGQVLVGPRGEVGLPDPGQQLPEGRVTAGVRAQYEGVDEEADEVVELLVGASGDG